MFDGLTITSWWEGLSEKWQKILIRNLDLEGLFGNSDLEYLTAITELDCSASSIDDLSPLVCLPQLEYVDISDTEVRNFAPLQYMPALKEVHATFCYGIDMSVFEKLKKLCVLDVSYPKSRHRNWKSLESLVNLEEFYGNACGIEGITPFLNLEHLQVLSVHFNYFSKSELAILEEELSSCRIMG